MVDPHAACLPRRALGLGIAVFVFTDGTDRVPMEIAALGLAEFTHPDSSHLINTADLGHAKPEQAAFAAAHRRIELVLNRTIPGHRVLFLDDSDRNTRTARTFGWRAVTWSSGRFC